MTSNANLFAQNPSDEVDFRFDDDAFSVQTVSEALNELKATLNGGAAYVDSDVATNGVIAGVGATEARVLEGSVITDNGIRRRVVIPAAGLTADFTVVADQAGNGSGGAFVAPAVPGVAGLFLAFHLVIDEQNLARVVFTGVAAIPEDSVPIFAAGEVGSKILAILVLRDDDAGAAEFAPAYVDNVGPDMRRLILQSANGEFDNVPVSDRDVAGGAVINAIVMHGVPISNKIRGIYANIRVDGTDLNDTAALSNGGDTDGAAARNGSAVSTMTVAGVPGATVAARVLSLVDGQTITVILGDAVNAAAAIRTIGFETFMGH